MLAFGSMIAKAAKDAGITVPDDPDEWLAAKDTHPHFFVFCATQLGRKMDPDEPRENAKVVATLTEAEIREITVEGLIERGYRYQT